MELAIRVLKAICDYTDPVAEDVITLRQLAASGQERKLPLDELACAIIARERETPRAKGYGTGSSRETCSPVDFGRSSV